jgi:hypothetical protein
MNQYLNSLESSTWLQHIKSVLDAAIFIARVNTNRIFEFLKESLFSPRLLQLKRKMFLFIVLMVGIERHNVVHYHLFFSVHTIVLYMVFE